MIDAIREAGLWELVGLLDDVCPERTSSLHRGVPVLGGREHLQSLRVPGEIADAFIAIGDSETRLRLADELLSDGYRLATIMHPRATVSATARVAEPAVSPARGGCRAAPPVRPKCVRGQRRVQARSAREPWLASQMSLRSGRGLPPVRP